jgi:hypothetical protein
MNWQKKSSVGKKKKKKKPVLRSSSEDDSDKNEDSDEKDNVFTSESSDSEVDKKNVKTKVSKIQQLCAKTQ